MDPWAQSKYQYHYQGRTPKNDQHINCPKMTAYTIVSDILLLIRLVVETSDDQWFDQCLMQYVLISLGY
jgi:hypothetical protein